MSSGDPLQNYDSTEMGHDTVESLKIKMFSTYQRRIKDVEFAYIVVKSLSPTGFIKL